MNLLSYTYSLLTMTHPTHLEHPGFFFILISVMPERECIGSGNGSSWPTAFCENLMWITAARSCPFLSIELTKYWVFPLGRVIAQNQSHNFSNEGRIHERHCPCYTRVQNFIPQISIAREQQAFLWQVFDWIHHWNSLWLVANFRSTWWTEEASLPTSPTEWEWESTLSSSRIICRVPLQNGKFKVP